MIGRQYFCMNFNRGIIVYFRGKGGTGMIEILKEESLEEREMRRTTAAQQMAVRKKEKQNGVADKASLLPKNIRQVGDVGKHTKVYFEDYVMTYIKQQAAFGKDREDILIFYGDKREIDGETYYFVSGALMVEEVNSCLYPILFNQEDWKGINECARQFFSGFAVLGWALLCEGEDLELKTRILETHEEFFGEEQPVFMEYSKVEKEEKVYLYRRGKMHLQTGHYIYYDKNEKMQNYMIYEKGNVEKVEEESVDHAARQFRMVVQEKQEEKKRKRTSFLLYSTALTLAVVVMLIGITLLGNYEKMENMENILYEMADDTTKKEYTLNTVDDALNEKGITNNNVQSELEVQEEDDDSLEQKQDVFNNETQEHEKANLVNQETLSQTGEMQPQTEEKNVDSMAVEKSVEEIQLEQQSEENESQSQEENVQSSAGQETGEQENSGQEDDNQVVGEQNIEAQTIENQEINSQEVEKQKIEESIKGDGMTEMVSEQEIVEEVSPEYQTYIIKKGDTLEKINYMFYGSENRIKEICELNHIENQDNICYGEKIILPY